MSTRPGPAVYVAGLVALLLFAGFMALGIWQVERRTWKLNLIEQVAARAHAAPVITAQNGIAVRMTERKNPLM